MRSISRRVGQVEEGLTVHTALVPLFCEACREGIDVAEDFTVDKLEDSSFNCICKECRPFTLGAV